MMDDSDDDEGSACGDVGVDGNPKSEKRCVLPPLHVIT